MKRLELDELEAQAAEFNRLVQISPALDRFCSSTYWALPAHLAFSSFRPPWVLRLDSGYVALALNVEPTVRMVLEPLEAVWGLACPFVGPDPTRLVEEFLAVFSSLRKGPLPLRISGLRKDSLLHRTLQRSLQRSMLVIPAPGTRVYRASLEGGEDGFLRRRSAKFRANLRRAESRARSADIEFEVPASPTSLVQALATYRRMIAVEHRSWKGAACTGLIDTMMRAFYRHMLARIWPEGMIRALFARYRSEDVGFVLGAMHQGTYRGLQASFDRRFAHLSLGSLLHWEMIRRVCEEEATWYDMGVEASYKAHWAEDVREFTQLLAI